MFGENIIKMNVCLIACIASTAGGLVAEEGAEERSTYASGLYIFVDELDDESNVKLKNNLGTMSLEDEKWDDHRRFGFGFMSQRIVGETAGFVLKYGIEIGYTGYGVNNNESDLDGEAIMLSPRIGLGVHVAEWVFIEGVAFGGLGLSQFTYENSTFGIDEKSEQEIATEYGVQVNAYFALSETLMLGARVGWMSQHLEGTFEGGGLSGDTDFESDSEGLYYGLMFGLRF